MLNTTNHDPLKNYNIYTILPVWTLFYEHSDPTIIAG